MSESDPHLVFPEKNGGVHIFGSREHAISWLKEEGFREIKPNLWELRIDEKTLKPPWRFRLMRTSKSGVEALLDFHLNRYRTDRRRA